MMGSKDLNEVAKQAEKIAMGVHESLREIAFKSAFEAILQSDRESTPSTQRKSSGKSSSGANKTKESDNDVEQLMHVDRTAHLEVQKAETALDRALHILKIANDQFDIDGLKPSQIALVLTNKFRCKTSRQAVQSALDAAGDKADRVPRKGGAVYRIMGKGESYLAEPKGESGASQNSDGKVPKKSIKMSKKSKSNLEDQKKSGRKQLSGRPSAKKVLIQLCQNGFFSSAKALPEIVTHIDESLGYKFKLNELSTPLVRLLRDEAMSRSKNSEGQYEYKSK